MFSTLIFICAATFFTYRTLRLLSTGRRVLGELIDYQSFQDDEGDWLHRPVYRFSDESGQLITACNPLNVWVVHKPPVGQRFDLIYNPTNPSQVVRMLWYDLWFGPALLWIVGLIGLMRAVLG